MKKAFLTVHYFSICIFGIFTSNLHKKLSLNRCRNTFTSQRLRIRTTLCRCNLQLSQNNNNTNKKKEEERPACSAFWLIDQKCALRDWRGQQVLPIFSCFYLDDNNCCSEDLYKDSVAADGSMRLLAIRADAFQLPLTSRVPCVIHCLKAMRAILFFFRVACFLLRSRLKPFIRHNHHIHSCFSYFIFVRANFRAC